MFREIFGLTLASLVVVNGYQNESLYSDAVGKLLKTGFKFNNNPQISCSSHLEQYIKGVTQNKGWALRMFDSIEKFPDGILMGRLEYPGHFDECVDVVQEEFQGKHCMVRALINMSPKGKPEKIFPYGYGVCVPSTCTSQDVEILVNDTLSKLGIELNFLKKIYVTEQDCSVNELRPLRTEDWTVISILIGLILVSLASTVYDVTQRVKYKQDKPNQLWSSFSIYTNFQSLFKISHGESQMKCLHGIRSLSFAWVILGHSYFTYIYAAAINLGDVPKISESASFTPIGNGFVSVDSFFFLSGLLVCVIFFRDISRKGSFDVPVSFIHRYMRLTPAFALLMLVQATVVSRMGNGPFWNKNMDDIERGCRDVWWSGLLYIQNYAKSTTRCLGQSWYLSADMQMYWISPLILYPLLWWPRLAPYFLSLITLIAALISFSIGYINELEPNMSVVKRTLKQFQLEYSPFHTRMAPWLIGLATGYIICGMRAKKIRLRLSPTWVVIGWAVAIALCFGSVFAYNRFHTPDYTQVEASLYLAFHRVGWGLCLAWVVIACVGGYGGLINSFLSLDFFQPLAKLSYCNFLLHMSLQQIRLFSSRTNQYIRHFDIVHVYFGDVLLSNLISIPIYLLFEIPFMHIDRYFFQKLEIFPYPFPRNKKEIPENVKIDKSKSEEAGNGKVNPGFDESSKI